MNVVIDLRCLQDKWRTGVGEYTWQILSQLKNWSDLKINGFLNAIGQIDLPQDLNNVLRITRGRIPNKLMNLKFFWRWGAGLDELASHSGKVDLLWLPNPGFVNIRSNIPTLLTIHDISFIHWPEFFPHKGRWWFFPAVRRFLSSGLPERSLIACVSEHTAADVKQFFPKLASKIRIVPPGLNEKYFIPVTKEKLISVKKKYNLPEKFLLSLGTVEPRKNYQTLLRAYEILAGINSNTPELIIAGGWGWRYSKIKKIHEKSQFKNKIKFIGYVADDDKPALYQLASIFLFPSLYEGIGLPPLEAMASGCPVIASHTSSLPEVLGESAILLPPDLPVAWAQTINWLWVDNAEQNKLSVLGKKQASKFSWSRTTAAYHTLFEELINLS